MFEGIDIAAVVLAAGSGRRMNAGVNKVWLRIQGTSILERSLERFCSTGFFKTIVLVANPAELPEFQSFLASCQYGGQIVLVTGGAERQQSVHQALQYLLNWTGWSNPTRLVAIHDAVRPLITVDLIQKGIAAALKYKAVGLAVPLKDTVKMVDSNQMVLNTPDRSRLWAMQTPQIFDLDLIAECHQKAAEGGFLFTDDCSAVEYAGYPVKLVMGSYENIKITTPEDLKMAETLLNEGERTERRTFMRIGQGIDVHRLVPGRRLILGGMEIPYELGLLGHSDADVLVHAIMDALLGAIGGGDIGRHFPDTDPQYQDADSLQLLRHVSGMIKEKGFRLVNLDATVIAQKPKLASHIPLMREKIAEAMSAQVEQISVKATTTEGLGFTGRGEGIEAMAVVLLE